MSAATRQLAQFAAGIDHTALPEAVTGRTKALILDQFGIATRARREAALNDAMTAALAALGLGTGEASVIGDAQGYAPPAAAFYNGNLGHCLDFDDTHARGSIHPSAPIVPAALAAAEMTGADGATVVAAVTAGYEVQIRLSLALGPSAHYRQGFHPTATCGVFGAAAAAGRIFGLDADRMADAFGLCGSQAVGSMQYLVNGSWNKAYHTGWAAMGGLVAATFARAGFRGAAEAIEGRAGFLHGYSTESNPALAVAGLGEEWETLQIAVKPYPSCRYGHAAMDALIALRDEHGLDWREIESVEVGLPQTGYNLIGDPPEEKQNPQNYVDGQFSMPFVGAVAVRDGAMGWDSYARHLDDADTLALCRRIRPVVDPVAEAEFPAYMSGVARVRTSAGELEKVVVIAKGEPENFLTDAELRAKFDDLTAPSLDQAARDALANAALGLEALTDTRELMALARPAATETLRAAGGDD
jgi:2-methylcitrate dehydratase PrpD